MFFKKSIPVIDTPTEADLKSWAYGEWIEYQAWLFHHGFLTLYDWQQLRDEAQSWKQRPLLSVVTPVFNTAPDYLAECIYSVQTQAYPNWEMCLVDDGSDNPATIACLEQLVKDDPRLHLHRFSNNQGICHATNQALAMARGEYVVFLDHDDRLAPNALYEVVKLLREYPNTDIVYSDRDMLSPNGKRFMHLFKPDWSPETLLSGNYLFHLLVYRRELLEKLEGVRVGKEGSQDYDLILRAAELQPQVQHLTKVLYHWRQHQQSVAMEHNVKDYAYQAGIAALQEALQRRSLVADVSENHELWRGHYRVHLHVSESKSYQILQLNSLEDYANQINQACQAETETDYLIILGQVDYDQESITELISWLEIEDVGIVTAKIVDQQEKFIHAGLVQRHNGIPLALYEGFPENTPGYMAVTAIVRNVSTPQANCCVIRRSLWQQLGGLNTNYIGCYAMLDFALRTLTSGKRIVYTPFARFVTTNEWQQIEWLEKDRQIFVEKWNTWLRKGDPYYNSYLSLDVVDMGLRVV
jgi:GT2 family glycosyltransferase